MCGESATSECAGADYPIALPGEVGAASPLTALIRHCVAFPCPICGGHGAQPRGQGRRCAGFTSADRAWANCTREEWAGSLSADQRTSPPSYAHRLAGACPCGELHGSVPWPSDQPKVRPGITARRSWPIRAAYGRVMALHERIDRADGTKSYVWLSPNGQRGLHGLPSDSLLYGAEQIARAARSWPIVVSEGEKSADALRSLGIQQCVFVATVTGAPRPPSMETLKVLGGRRVFLWPDNDAVGRQQMTATWEQLEDIGVRELRWVEWPDAPDKGDAADFVGRGGDSAALARLMGSAASERSSAPVDGLSDGAADTAEITWDEPFSLEVSGPVPDFPVAALPGWLAEYVGAEALATQTPMDLAGMLSLAAVAAVAAGRVRVEIRSGWVEPVNIFVAVAMRPGERKSSVFDVTMGPVYRFEEEWALRLAPEVGEADSRRRIAEQVRAIAEKKAASALANGPGPESDEALASARAASAALDEAPVRRHFRLVADDATPEALASLLAEHDGRITVSSAEGGIFDLMAGRYSSGGGPNLDIYLKAHAGDTLQVDRRGRPPEHVAQPALTIGIAVQPHVIQSLADRPGFRGRGLIGRFLYALPASRVGYRSVSSAAVPADVLSQYDQNLRALARRLAALPAPATVRLSAEAFALLQSFAEALEPRLAEEGDLGHVADWATKLVGALGRIAGLLHFADGAWMSPIDGAHMRAALEFGPYLEAHALAAFDLMAADPARAQAKRVLKWIRTKDKTSFTVRDCFTELRGQALLNSVESLRPILALMEDHGYIRSRALPPQQVGKRGRPRSPIYDVNPLALNPHNPHISRSSLISAVSAISADPGAHRGLLAPPQPATAREEIVV